MKPRTEQTQLLCYIPAVLAGWWLRRPSEVQGQPLLCKESEASLSCAALCFKH